MSRRPPPTLGCVAPREFQPLLAARLAAAGFRTEWVPRPAPSPSRLPDPYQLTAVARQFAPAVNGLLLVAPRRRSPARVAPKSVVNNRPIGLVFADQPADLEPWLTALAQQNAGSRDWAVMAMWKDSYIAWGRKYYHWLKPSARGPVRTWFGDRLNRDAVCERLAQGPRLVVYVGHGRPHGLSGYHGLRYRHLEAVPQRGPCGAVMCLSCDTLNRFRGTYPFGLQWTHGGRAAAFFGSVEAVKFKANIALAQLLGQVFATAQARTIGDLVVCLDELIAANPKLKYARRGFQSYRLVGNPLQPLHALA